MRFGKGTRGWKVAGRRIFGDREEDDQVEPDEAERSDNGGVATEERNALLSPSPDDEADSMEEVSSADIAMSGDPTQHLLTALGRFQRQVAKGETGAPQELWTDECINQLIVGIKIAYAQGWDGIREALTDTARILQTYEEAGQAQLGIPFLQDSYEILCLMVGDLIVDNVRSGVMQKWRDRFQRAVRELDRTGLRLIEDDEEEEEAEEATVTSPAVADDFFSEDTAASEPVEDLSPATPDTFPFDENAVTSETPSPVEDHWFSEETETAPESPAPDPEYTGVMETDSEPEYLESKEEQIEAPPSGTDDDGFLVFEAVSEEEEVSPFEAPEEEPALEKDRALDSPFLDIPEEITEGVDQAPLANEVFPPAPEAEETPAPQEEPDLFHYEEAAEAEAAPEPVSEFEAETETEMAPELAAGIDLESGQPPTPAPMSLVDDPPASDPDPVPAPTAEVEAEADLDDGSPEALLRTTQQAMARGDVKDAKMLALRLAAQMAQLEADRALEEVCDAETQLESFDRLIAAAEEEARHSEEALQAAEGSIGARQSEFDAKRQHTGHLRDRAAEAERSIADLEGQIKALQEQREAEMRHLGEIQAELEDALAAESRVQTELDGLSEAEQYARDSLEAAQDNVEKHRAARAEQEAVISSVRDKYARRCRAAEDIENTIAAFGGPPPASRA